MPRNSAQESSRVAAGRRRARAAQVVLAAAGIAAFGSAMALARTTQAGHARQALRPLAAPRSFQRIVRRELLAAGGVAPPQGPPSGQTSTS